METNENALSMQSWQEKFTDRMAGEMDNVVNTVGNKNPISPDSLFLPRVELDVRSVDVVRTGCCQCGATSERGGGTGITTFFGNAYVS